MDMKIKIILFESEKDGVFGPGVYMLLKGVEKNGSLNKAAKELDMSYSKAFKLISRTEIHLGFQLIERLKGSRGSILTEKAKKLVDFYFQANERANTELKLLLEDLKKDL